MAYSSQRTHLSTFATVSLSGTVEYLTKTVQTGIVAREILVAKHLFTDCTRVYSTILSSDVEPDLEGSRSTPTLARIPTRSMVVIRALEAQKDIQKMRGRGVGSHNLIVRYKSRVVGRQNAIPSRHKQVAIWVLHV